MTIQKVGIAAIGDVTDINCWSNIPYYFFSTGKKENLFHIPWQIDLKKVEYDRVFWNLGKMLTLQKPGGFQYSNTFLKKIENQIPPQYYTNTVISFNQVFPDAQKIVESGGKIIYYIDGTLHSLFSSKSYNYNFPLQQKKRAIELEKKNYRFAHKIVCMANWTKEILIDFYKIPEEKISVILPGANINPPSSYKFPDIPEGIGTKTPLIIGFVGKDWERKGLPEIIQIKNILKRKNYKIKILVIGRAPKNIVKDNDIQFTGFIDKNKNQEEFTNLISTCHIGCLFSKDEALGISILEFLKVGVPVAGYNHQGMADTIPEDSGMKFDLSDPLEKIALSFEKFIINEQFRNQLFENARKREYWASWERCINEWKLLLNTL